MNDTKSAAKLSAKNLILYSILAMPIAFGGIPLYIHVPDYYATQFNISIQSLGIILFLLRFFDAFQDPFIGYISDRYQKYRIILMMFAGISLIISFILIFQPIQHYLLIWFAVFMLVSTTSFSILSINLNTTGGLWSENYHQKTVITTYREVFGLLGLLLGMIVPSVLILYLSKKQSFLILGIILSILMLVGLLFFNTWYKRIFILNRTVYSFSLKDWKLLFDFPKISKYFFSVYFISMFASSIPFVLVLFFIRDRLGVEKYTGLFLSFYFISGMLGTPIWQWVSKKYDKQVAWIIAMIFATFSFMWAFFLESGDAFEYSIICIVSGIAFSADLILPPSILSDHIDQYKLEKKASFYFSFLTFLSKLSLGISSVFALSLLDKVGFQAGMENQKQALDTLSFLYAGLPCLIKVSSVMVLLKVIKINSYGD